MAHATSDAEHGCKGVLIDGVGQVTNVYYLAIVGRFLLVIGTDDT